MKLRFASISLLIATIGMHDFSVAADKLQMYKCDEIQSCTGNCESTDQTINFMINPDRSTVFAKYYKNGQFYRSGTFANCIAIFDKDNWDCSSTREIGNITVMDMKKMADGIFSMEQIRIENGKSHASPLFCAK